MSKTTRKSQPAVFEALEGRALFSAAIIGYLPDYEFSKFITTSGSSVTKDTVAWKNLTQVNYFSLEPNSNGTLKATTSSGFDYTKQLPYLIKEASNNGVSVNITIGGGDAGSIADVTALVRGGQTAWTTFAGSLKSVIASETAGIKNLPAGGVGIDLDYEPTDGTVSTTDVANYGKLIQTIHHDDPGIRLSAAVLAAKQRFTNSSTQDYILSPTAVQNLTSINVMDYQITNMQAPVNTAETYIADWASFITSAKDPLTGLAVGGHKSQLNFGVPFYGVGNNGSSFATYPQILSGTRVATTANYIETKVGGVDYYSDDAATLTAKVDYALSNGFGGVMAWELGQDVLPESSSTSLLSAIKTAVTNYVAKPTGSVSGSVKTSANAAVAGVTVYLDANNNGKLDAGELSTVTSSTGAYSFSNVPVAAYTVRQTPPAGDTQTSPASNAGHAITIVKGSNFTNENFTDTVSAAPAKLSGTIISAAVSNNSTLKNAFDGNISTDYHSTSASGNWIGLDLGTAKTLTQIKFAGASADPYNLEGGTFQASNSANFSSVVNLYTIPNTVAPSSTALTTINLNITGQYRYVRFVAPAASHSDLGEIEFFGH